MTSGLGNELKINFQDGHHFTLLNLNYALMSHTIWPGIRKNQKFIFKMIAMMAILDVVKSPFQPLWCSNVPHKIKAVCEKPKFCFIECSDVIILKNLKRFNASKVHTKFQINCPSAWGENQIKMFNTLTDRQTDTWGLLYLYWRIIPYKLISQLSLNPWHREKELHNNQETTGRQNKQSNQLSLPIKMIAKLEWTQSNAHQNKVPFILFQFSFFPMFLLNE